MNQKLNQIYNKGPSLPKQGTHHKKRLYVVYTGIAVNP